MSESSTTNTRVELRPNGYPLNRVGQQTLDEVVARNVDFHIENMDQDKFWFGLSSGDKWWSFWLQAKRTKKGVVIELTCNESPEDTADLTTVARARESG